MSKAVGAPVRGMRLLCWLVLVSFSFLDHVLAEARLQADAIVINKAQRELQLFSKGKMIRSYRVALGYDPVGPKTQKNDGKTPEGRYIIDGRNPHSHYHLSLHVSYPNATDRARAHKLRVDPGGEIMIHGLPPGSVQFDAAHPPNDWTLGCIAVNDNEIEEIWRLVPNGTRVQINP